MITNETFHRWHIDVLLAVRCLALDGRIPGNEEDLAGQLGYEDLDEFERGSSLKPAGRQEVERAIQDLGRLGLLEVDERFCMTLTQPGQDAATRLVGHGE